MKTIGTEELNYEPLNIRLYEPLPSAYIGNEETAVEAFNNVCKGAGAILPKRDSVDARIVDHVINNTGSVPLTIADVPGNPFPVLNSLPAPIDTDQDGMPDEWENMHGLDTNNAADRNTVDGNGYTMLENYLNGLEFVNTVTGIELSSTSDSFILVTWVDIFLGEEGYIIERALPGGDFTHIDSINASQNPYIDSSANAESEYLYRIKAYSELGESPFSDEVAYAPVYFNLTISVNGEGTVSASPENDSYLSGTQVTLSATPESGWEFNRWSGNASGTENPVSIIADTDKTITATFSEIVTVNNVSHAGNCRLYPNPAQDELTIELSNEITPRAEVELFDYTGRTVFNDRIQGREKVLNLSHLASGIYWVRIRLENEEYFIEKLIKN